MAFFLNISTVVVLTVLFSLKANAGEEEGSALFSTKCAVCHTTNQGIGHAAGPNLFGIIGRNIASAQNYDYSPAMRTRTEEKWDLVKLDRFLTRPQAFQPGTRMIFPGLTNEATRRELIVFLEKLR